MIGEPGPYVQSDYLYAVEVSKFISKYGVSSYMDSQNIQVKRISSDVHWYMNMHSFSDFFPGSKTIGDTIASCAHISLDETTMESFRRTYVPVMERYGVEDPEQVL